MERRMGSRASTCQSHINPVGGGAINGNGGNSQERLNSTTLQQHMQIEWTSFDRHFNDIVREYVKRILSTDEVLVSSPMGQDEAGMPSAAHNANNRSSGSNNSNKDWKAKSEADRSSARIRRAVLQMERCGVCRLVDLMAHAARCETRFGSPQRSTASGHQTRNSFDVLSPISICGSHSAEVSLSSTAGGNGLPHPTAPMGTRPPAHTWQVENTWAWRDTHWAPMQHQQKEQLHHQRKLLLNPVSETESSDPHVHIEPPAASTVTAINATTNGSAAAPVDPDGDAGSDAGASYNKGVLAQGLATDVETPVESICKWAAHMNLEDEDLVQLMMLLFDVVHAVLDKPAGGVSDEISATADPCTSNVILLLLKSTVVPLLQNTRRALREMVSCRSSSRNRKNNNSDTGYAVPTLPKGKQLPDARLCESSNISCMNSDASRQIAAVPPSESLHRFFCETCPQDCRSHNFQLLVQQSCLVLHFAVLSSSSSSSNTVSSSQMVLDALNESASVLYPLRTRALSLRQQYIYVHHSPDAVVPISVLSLASDSVVLDGILCEAVVSLAIPYNAESYKVMRSGSICGNDDQVVVIDNRSDSKKKSGAADDDGGGGGGEAVEAGTATVTVVVYPLCVTAAGVEHHFFFQTASLRAAWLHRLDVVVTTCSRKNAAAVAVAPININAFLRNRFAFNQGPGAYTFIRPLGAGTFGRVLLVRHRLTGRLFAMKIIRKSCFHALRNIVEVRRERAILESLDNPYIIRIHATFQTLSRVYFLLDYLPGGELLRHVQIAPNHHFDEQVARFFTAELAIALDHLRQRGILHRDVKGDNLLLDEDGHIVLTDFGFAKRIVNDSGQTIRQRVCCGTLAYIAPEMLHHNHTCNYGFEVDWWSLGVVLFTILTGYFPFLTTTRRGTALAIQSQPLQFPNDKAVSAEAKDLLLRLINKDPQRRLTSLAALKEHPFFCNFDWEACAQRRMRPPVLLHGGAYEKKDTPLATPLQQQPLAPAKTGPGNIAQQKTGFLEELEQLRLLQDIYSEGCVPPTTSREDDVFSSFYARQEENGSDRDEDADVDYSTIMGESDVETSNQRRTSLNVSRGFLPSPAAAGNSTVEDLDDLVGEFNESAYLSTGSMNAVMSTNAVRASTSLFFRPCPPPKC
ncbi:RAC-beta serine/threonine protein kinase [Trypanosoma grayi]|uniref:RAC-beta serine/threonine protein kinase n=1 Tax=Trypanosoma grayi TaxID=71804 RepID=UPI0004F40A18|nr:RAC-beta serine/threonine protein kinase [Trypanosoma grayi]KEG07982.1 RAC-beta serine/threonine protein kinase [Trypanosoma grayi]